MMRSFSLATGFMSMLAFAGLTSLAQPAAKKPAAPKKYNIIYILADDLGYSELGCYGNKFNETPNVDKLASEGVRFTHFYAPAPVCSPYRGALMTGQYPARIGITDYLRPNAAQHLGLEHTTIAEMFQQNGYRTGIVGKWHLSGYVKAGASEETLPDKHGFDEVMVSENEGIAEGWYFHPYLFNKDIKKVLPGDHEYITDRQNEEALAFISRNKNKPFFLYLSHYAVHTTVHGKPELVEHFRRKPGAGTAKPINNPDNDLYKRWPADSRAKHNNPHLAAQLFVVDQGVGMIRARLKELGLDKNTIIVFTSDNGGETTITTNKPLRGGKSMLYEGGVTEPCVVWAPTLFKPGVVTQPAVNMDFYPTFMNLISAKPNAQKLDGINITSVLKNTQTTLPKRVFYWHYPLDKPHFLGGRSAGSIRDGDWKLIEFFDDHHNELYNLKSDIGEQQDLASKYPQKVKQLADELAKWRTNVHAKM